MSKVLSGQKTVTTAGTAVALGSDVVNESILVKADPANTGKIFIGNTGANTVTSGTGYILAAGDVVVYDMAGNLSNIFVNSDANNQKVCWTVLNF